MLSEETMGWDSVCGTHIWQFYYFNLIRTHGRERRFFGGVKEAGCQIKGERRAEKGNGLDQVDREKRSLAPLVPTTS